MDLTIWLFFDLEMHCNLVDLLYPLLSSELLIQFSYLRIVPELVDLIYFEKVLATHFYTESMPDIL